MKKGISFIIVLALVLVLVPSSLAEVVFSTYDDALVELLAQVQQEVADRKIEKTATLNAGSYLVGTDLPAGSYNLVCKYEGSMWADINITSDAGEGEMTFSQTVFSTDNDMASIKGEGKWFVNLKDGDLLKCDSEITLTISAGVLFE